MRHGSGQPTCFTTAPTASAPRTSPGSTGQELGGSPRSVELYKGLVERRHDHEGTVLRKGRASRSTREPGDPRFHGLRFAKGEHSLFRFIANWLNARGFDLIKKRAQKDGH